MTCKRESRSVDVWKRWKGTSVKTWRRPPAPGSGRCREASRPKPVEERRYRWEGQDDNEPIFGEEVWLHELQPFLCLIKLEYEIMHGWLVKAESWKDKWGKQDIKHYLEISISKYFPHFWPIGWDICDMWPQSPKQLGSLPFTTGNLVNISPPPLPSHPPLPQRWNWAPRNGTYSVLEGVDIPNIFHSFYTHLHIL